MTRGASDTILKKDNPRTITAMFGQNLQSGFRGEDSNEKKHQRRTTDRWTDDECSVVAIANSSLDPLGQVS